MAQPRSLRRMLALYATISLVSVLAFGAILVASYRSDARKRGLAEGLSEAMLLAQTSIEPRLDGRPLTEGLLPEEKHELELLVAPAVAGHHVLRLRLRGLTGGVVWSDDHSGFGEPRDDEALEAAAGGDVARLDHLNSDGGDAGGQGVAAVEVYVPLNAGSPVRRVGVLEVYLPYAPIRNDVTAGLRGLYLDLGIALSLLYLALLVISASVSRGLRHAAKRNAFLAEHDPLTDLPNRALFHRRARAAVELAAYTRQKVIVAVIDLDRFKEINDTLGHHNGDLLLTELARRLARHTRPFDTIARLGGDEFGVVLHDADTAEAALWRLRRVINEDFRVSGLMLSLDSSIGFVVAPDDGTNVDELLRHADVAMYSAKSQHAGVVCYDPAQDHYDAANLTLLGDLRCAIAEDQLVLHYQPKARVADGTIEAVEALVRWQHPTKGLIYPDQFIPLAEQTDLIDALTTWVLDTALREIRDLGPAWAELRVAVNVSARNLNQSSFAAEVASVLQSLDVDADRLIVEITETALLSDSDRVIRTLGQLAEAGVQASLDDFGQGQTSLRYLAQLPISELKIDKSFVVDMVTNPAHAAIVHSIVDLGHNLGFRVVAEGVESDEILTELTILGCDIAQGYLLARPMAIDGLVGWLAESGGPLRTGRFPAIL